MVVPAEAEVQQVVLPGRGSESITVTGNVIPGKAWNGVNEFRVKLVIWT